MNARPGDPSVPPGTQGDASGTPPTGSTSAVSGAGSTFRPVFAALAEPASAAVIYLGLVTAAIGFLLIGIGWAEVASSVTVGLQMPYLISAGFTGLGLVVVGAATVGYGAKRQAAAEHSEQLQTLNDLLAAVRHEIEMSRAPSVNGSPPPGRRRRRTTPTLEDKE